MMNQQQHTLQEVYDAFQNNQQTHLDVKPLLESIHDTNHNDQTRVLRQQIENKRQLTQNEFKKLFNPQNTDISYLQALYAVLKKPNKEYIDYSDLQQINKQYNLGMNDNDLMLIIEQVGDKNRIAFEQVRSAVQDFQT